jgi:hypothetical protein
MCTSSIHEHATALTLFPEGWSGRPCRSASGTIPFLRRQPITWDTHSGFRRCHSPGRSGPNRASRSSRRYRHLFAGRTQRLTCTTRWVSRVRVADGPTAARIASNCLEPAFELTGGMDYFGVDSAMRARGYQIVTASLSNLNPHPTSRNSFCFPKLPISTE